MNDQKTFPIEDPQTPDENGYNGYANKETWLVALWIDNDRGLYEESREMARTFADRPTPEHIFARKLETWINDHVRPEPDASLWSDLTTTALARVDWYEIAENYIEEIQEEASV